MLEIGLFGFVAALVALGLRRPFLWVLAYIYVDVLAPQKISYLILAKIPISLIVFLAAFGGWLLLDDKRDSRFGLRQALLVLLLLYCGYTTLVADFPEDAAAKWSWVWKALFFAIFLPMTLRTRLRIEATTFFMVMSAAAIIINGGIKTALGGGGYGALRLYVDNNTGLYEGSIISCVAIAIIPLILWLTRHGSIFPTEWRVKLFSAALIFACLLIPVGTQARTGLICIAVLGVLLLRSTRRRFLYLGLMAGAALLAVPFLPQSFTARMSTIENHEADQSASTRIAVWKWTWEYVQDHPLGGGFDAYRGNKISYHTNKASTAGATTSIESERVVDEARAYHSSYFEMLGEQGYFGFLLWLWIQILGIWQMERLRSRWRKRALDPGGPGNSWQAPLAEALQQAHIIYMVGSLFVGIAFQPFILLLIGLEIGVWTYLRRIENESQLAVRKARPTGGLVVPGAAMGTAR